MKNIIFVLLIFALFSGKLIAQSKLQNAQGSAGTEFILCFPYSWIPYRPSKSIYLASYQDTAIITITCKAFPAFNKNIILPPNSYIRYTLSYGIDPEIPASEEVSDNAIMVSSTAPITCYFQTSNSVTDEDGTFALPKEMQGLVYSVLSYKNNIVPPRSLPHEIFPGEFIIGAFEDSTEITINVTSPTINSIDTIPKLHYSLLRGQCIQIRASVDSARYDLTGSIIFSTKPVAVYSGHELTKIPSGYCRGSCDEAFLLEAIPPISQWGKTFLCRRLAPREKFLDTIDITPQDIFDVVRVLASQDNTIIKVNDTVLTTLQSASFIDIEDRDHLLIQGSNPILVAEYSHSLYNNDVAGDSAGGPFMALIPPMKQRYNDLTFFNNLNNLNVGLPYIVHYINIFGDTSIRNTITLDGKKLPDTGFVNLPFSANGEQFSIGSYLVDSGVHHISTTNPPEKGFTLLVYGFGDGFGYGYGVGSLNKPPVKDRVIFSPILGNTIAFFTTVPNPFSTETKLNFTINQYVYVTIEVYDILGNKVFSYARSYESGNHEINLDGSTLPTGMLYARISTGVGEVKTLKLIHEK